MVRLNDQFLAFRQSIDTNLAEAKIDELINEKFKLNQIKYDVCCLLFFNQQVPNKQKSHYNSNFRMKKNSK